VGRRVIGDNMVWGEGKQEEGAGGEVYLRTSQITTQRVLMAVRPEARGRMGALFKGDEVNMRHRSRHTEPNN
jgi:hypothetical protein